MGRYEKMINGGYRQMSYRRPNYKQPDYRKVKRGRGPRRSRSKRYFACLIIVLLLAICAFVLYVWAPLDFTAGAKGAKDGGATITQASLKESEEEVRARLNQQVKDSMMTLSVSSKCEIKDGRVKVNVINAESNTLDQSFELMQNGQVLYSSGLISPGESVVWCDAPAAAPGEATVTIHAHAQGSAENYGNTQAAKVILHTE